MDDLPAEILQHVAGCLDSSHIASLASFASVNKACYAAANVWLFRTIHLQVNTNEPAQLQEEATRWTETLHRAQSRHHVRRVLIVHQPWERKVNNEDFFETYKVYGGDYSPINEGVFGSDGPFQPWDREKDSAWLPLAALIGTMSNVTDLVYMPVLTMPPCLLKVLHEQQPQCRLHLPRFRFKSLHEPTVDPHELGIATSPCLYSIAMQHTWRDSRGSDDWNQEALLRLVAGMAPNLRRVHSLPCHPVSSPALHHRRGMPRQPWPGFPDDAAEPSPGALEHLALLGQGAWSPTVLEGWQRATDFSVLRSLDIRTWAHSSVLGGAPENIHITLPGLKELRLQIRDMPGSGNSAESCVAFLSGLPPLETLDYYGSFGDAGEVLHCIFARHGPALRKLVLSQQVDLPAMLHMQQSCPRLEDLKIGVKRSLSDENEVAMYRALGRLPSLKELILVLDCSVKPRVQPGSSEEHVLPAAEPEEEFDDPIDRELWHVDGMTKAKRGHVRIMLLNTAVDEALAWSIWDTINEEREGKALKTLVLNTASSGSFGITDRYGESNLKAIVRYIGRSYRLERRVKNGEDDLTIRELGDHAREPADRPYRLGRPEGETDQGSALWIFRRIWPKKEGSASWHDDWSSLPLRK